MLLDGLRRFLPEQNSSCIEDVITKLKEDLDYDGVKINQIQMALYLFQVSSYSFCWIFETWVKWLRMQGRCLPATLEVTGSNPSPGKINLIENKHQRDS
jgi:hypothetical protein